MWPLCCLLVPFNGHIVYWSLALQQFAQRVNNNGEVSPPRTHGTTITPETFLFLFIHVSFLPLLTPSPPDPSAPRVPKSPSLLPVNLPSIPLSRNARFAPLQDKKRSLPLLPPSRRTLLWSLTVCWGLGGTFRSLQERRGAYLGPWAPTEMKHAPIEIKHL